MKKDYSAPIASARTSRFQKAGTQGKEEKQVDYSHLDIVSEVERLTGCSLHHVSRAEYAGRCPFPGCPSLNDAFRVWDRAVLDETREGKREKHFWCRRCDRSGDLIALVRQYKEAMTSELLTWSEAARSLGIDPRTWKAFAEGAEQPRKASTSSEKRRQQEARREKAGQAEVDLLSAWYARARAWLAVGQIVLKDGRTIPLDQARGYLQERGFSLEQAGTLGLAYMPTTKELPELATIPEAAILAPWRGRLLFPLSGPKGVHGYAGRSLLGWKAGMSAEHHKKLFTSWNETHPEKQIQRYYKTYQTAHYGYDEACNRKTLIIVEGEFDAASVRLALNGIKDIAVMAVGTHFQARLVPLNVVRVILALDTDQAGQQALERQKDDQEGRGLIVEIVRPPVGNDWNDCLVQVGADVMRAALLPAQEPQNMIAHFEREMIAISEQSDADAEENGIPRCWVCKREITEADFASGRVHMDTEPDRTRPSWGEPFCLPCWEQQCAPESSTDLHSSEQIAHISEPLSLDADGCIRMVPTGMYPGDYIEHWYAVEKTGQAQDVGKQTEGKPDSNRCSKHGKLLAYGDEHGGRYCAHVDCWERYRLIRQGAALGYPELIGVLDARIHMPDLSKEPLYHTEHGIAIYPTRPIVTQQLIASGADAWRDYVVSRDYQDIDQAVKAALSMSPGAE